MIDWLIGSFAAEWHTDTLHLYNNELHSNSANILLRNFRNGCGEGALSALGIVMSSSSSSSISQGVPEVHEKENHQQGTNVAGAPKRTIALRMVCLRSGEDFVFSRGSPLLFLRRCCFSPSSRSHLRNLSFPRSLIETERERPRARPIRRLLACVCVLVA